MAGLERLEKVEPGAIAESDAIWSVECNRDGAGQDGPPPDGAVPDDRVEQLRSPRRAHPVQSVLPGSAGRGDQRELMPAHEFGRRLGEIQDRRVRRQHPTRLQLHEALGPCLVCTVIVGLELFPLLEHVLPGLQNAAVEGDALPTSPLGPIHRQGHGQAQPFGSAEAGKVEMLQGWNLLRKVGKAERQLRHAPAEFPASLHRGRSTARGHDVGAAPRPRTACHRKYLGRYVADYFCGCGGVAKGGLDFALSSATSQARHQSRHCGRWHASAAVHNVKAVHRTGMLKKLTETAKLMLDPVILGEDLIGCQFGSKWRPSLKAPRPKACPPLTQLQYLKSRPRIFTFEGPSAPVHLRSSEYQSGVRMNQTPS